MQDYAPTLDHAKEEVRIFQDFSEVSFHIFLQFVRERNDRKMAKTKTI